MSIASTNRRRNRSFQVGPYSFQFPGSFGSGTNNLMDALLHGITVLVERFVLLLGPVLIAFALTIIGGLSWTFFSIILPMIYAKWKDSSLGLFVVAAHCIFVLFLLVQICFHYFCCVTTRNVGANYNRVVRELAQATHFVFPETPQQLETFRRDFETKMMIRVRRRQGRANINTIAAATTSSTANTNPIRRNHAAATETSEAALAEAGTSSVPAPTPGSSPIPSTPTAATTSNTQPVRSWMLMAPDEWGYCPRSRQPKPPRSHYDHVTKTLVLCLEHYCPWMFNVIGYFNYRYFISFLGFVDLAMLYAAILTYQPFCNTSGPLYKEHLQHYKTFHSWQRLHPMVPFRDERMPISLAFMLSLAIGLAVACLFGFHVYLTLTAQTTIEFHGNWVARRKARQAYVKYTNPYDLGWKRNFQQVFGDFGRVESSSSSSSVFSTTASTMLAAILVPSMREPDFLPLPLPGEAGKRWTRRQPQHGEQKALLMASTDKNDTGDDNEEETPPLLLHNESV